MKTLVLGIGNSIRTDDAVGLRVARLLRDRLASQEADVIEVASTGLELLDLMVGYDRVVVVDAIQTAGARVGEVYRLEPETLGTPDVAAPVHGVDLVTAIALGRRLGLALPKRMVIFAVEVADVTSFGDTCTPEVERAIPRVTEAVLRDIRGYTDCVRFTT